MCSCCGPLSSCYFWSLCIGLAPCDAAVALPLSVLGPPTLPLSPNQPATNPLLLSIAGQPCICIFCAIIFVYAQPSPLRSWCGRVTAELPTWRGAILRPRAGFPYFRRFQLRQFLFSDNAPATAGVGFSLHPSCANTSNPHAAPCSSPTLPCCDASLQ